MSHDLLIAVVEVSLLASLAADSFLLVHAFMWRDGPAWAVWRARVAGGVLASVGGLMLAVARPHWLALTSWVLIGLYCLAIGRLIGALANFILAFHLRRLIEGSYRANPLTSARPPR